MRQIYILLWWVYNSKLTLIYFFFFFDRFDEIFPVYLLFSSRLIEIERVLANHYTTTCFHYLILLFIHWITHFKWNTTIYLAVVFFSLRLFWWWWWCWWSSCGVLWCVCMLNYIPMFWFFFFNSRFFLLLHLFHLITIIIIRNLTIIKHALVFPSLYKRFNNPLPW